MIYIVQRTVSDSGFHGYYIPGYHIPRTLKIAANQNEANINGMNEQVSGYCIPEIFKS
jgi:hypothetical protein